MVIISTSIFSSFFSIFFDHFPRMVWIPQIGQSQPPFPDKKPVVLGGRSEDADGRRDWNGLTFIYITAQLHKRINAYTTCGEIVMVGYYN